MKVLGISASPRKGQTTDRLVQAVLDGVDGAFDTEFISLAGKDIRGCQACLACVTDNICRVHDDMYDIAPKVNEAAAIVFGAPNYYGMINALGHAFLERFYQFRHCNDNIFADKLGIAVGTGGSEPELSVRDIERFMRSSKIEIIGSVTANGANCCYTCGFGEKCNLGAVVSKHGEGTVITEDIIPSLDKQPECIDNARAIGKKLSERLKENAGQGFQTTNPA